MKRLVKATKKVGMIDGRMVAIDSSFVKTFSKHVELDIEGWNSQEEGYGFKMHVLLDTSTSIPLAVRIIQGLAHDSTLAVPLLKEAKTYLSEVAYVLGDKGYDSDSIVQYVQQTLHAKAAIPIKQKYRGKTYS